VRTHVLITYVLHYYYSNAVFDNDVIGKAHRGVMCSYQQSGSLSVDHSHFAQAVAATIAHEMGHNFGCEHDTDSCTCASPTGNCIMSPISRCSLHTHAYTVLECMYCRDPAPTVWSECSVKTIAHAIGHGMDYCLLNEPRRGNFNTPVCGNGILEAGEECDCGVPELCAATRCCNATTCKLRAGALCGSGECCDTDTCLVGVIKLV
jgi:predicted Zn-dependent protease